MKKRRKLDFLTDESSDDACPKKPRKRRIEGEDDSTSHTSSEGDSASDASTSKSIKKEKHKNGKHFKKWLVLEKFDGTMPLSIFLNQLDTCARYNGWDLEDKASHWRVSLKGNTAYIIDDENLERASCRRLIKRLKSQFGTEGQSSLYAPSCAPGDAARTRRYRPCTTTSTGWLDWRIQVRVQSIENWRL